MIVMRAEIQNTFYGFVYALRPGEEWWERHDHSGVLSRVGYLWPEITSPIWANHEVRMDALRGLSRYLSQSKIARYTIYWLANFEIDPVLRDTALYYWEEYEGNLEYEPV